MIDRAKLEELRKEWGEIEASEDSDRTVDLASGLFGIKYSHELFDTISALLTVAEAAERYGDTSKREDYFAMVQALAALKQPGKETA